MSTSSKPPKPGVVQDPWRTAPPVPTPPKVQRTPRVPVPSTQGAPEQGDTDDTAFDHYATLELPGYGGITVRSPQRQGASYVALRLLDFCREHAAQIEPTLTDFGVVFTQGALNAPLEKPLFYIQRRDGWMLAVPQAKTREGGAFQLIQAFLALSALPHVRPHLERYQIRPYKH